MRLLYVSHRAPIPTNTGGLQRSNLLIQAMQRVGEVRMVLLCNPEGSPPEDREAMRRDWGLLRFEKPYIHSDLKPWRWLRPIHPKLVQRAAHNLGQRQLDYQADPALTARLKQTVVDEKIDLIVGRYLQPTIHSGALETGLPVVLDVDDLDTRVYASRLEHGQENALGRAVVRRHLHQLQAFEPGLLKRFHHLWLASETDRKLIDHPSVSVLPNIPFTAGKPLPKPIDFDRALPEPNLLIVASMNHGPNARGVKHFLDRVWPGVHDAIPTARLRLVGSKMSDAQRQDWSAQPGVEVLGFVESLESVYAEAWATVCPIYEGGGTKIKVLESLMFGRAAALTGHSHYGYETHLPEGRGVMVGSDDTTLAQACIRLLSDRRATETLGRAGHDVLEAHYSFEAFAAVVQDTVQAQAT